MQRPPDYGIIYNWDGAPHGYSAYPQSIEQFLDKVYAPIADTQVGPLCLQSHCRPQKYSGHTRSGNLRIML